jgi:outer membrane protein OmpA-like peptidoglycan-associated protein
VVLFLAAAGPGATSAAAADSGRRVIPLVASAVDEPGRMIAIGISTLANLQVDTADIEIDWMVRQDRALGSVLDETSAMALLDLGGADLEALDGGLDLRAVMRFWPAGNAGANPGYLLVAQASLGAEVVRMLLEEMQDDKVILKAAQVDTDRLAPAIAMADLPLAPHDGVSAYLAASGEPLPPPGAETAAAIAPEPVAVPAARPIPAALPESEPGGQSFLVYFKFDEAELDRDDVQSVAAACRYAATLPRAKFVIAGHTDTAGPEAYNDRLGKRRADAVAAAIRNDPRFREALSVIDYGETTLAVTTEDEVVEPLNRRVEITIIEDE